MEVTLEANKELEPQWETVPEAAPHLKMSAQGLYAAIREEQLPREAVLRIGRRVRVNRKAVKTAK